MVPLTSLLPVAGPPLQLCPSCPPSLVGSMSSGGVCDGSSRHWLGLVGSGVHGNVGACCASSRFDLVKLGATCGSGRQELAITVRESGEQRPKLLVVVYPSLKT